MKGEFVLNNKSQEMSFQTIAVIILILVVLVLVILFVTGQFGTFSEGLGNAGTQSTDALTDALVDAGITDCGNGVCDTDETAESCPVDCS